MATLTTVRLNKNDAPSWGFRLQGGKDFGTPLVIQKVNGGSPAERAGLIAGDAVIKINNIDVFSLTHKDAQDVILRAGNSFDMSIHRGGSTWKPNIIPTGKIPKPTPVLNNVSPVTKTSLAAKPTENIGAIGTGHNNAAKPFVTNGGLQPVRYNCPIKLYSEDAIAETIAAQTEVLQGGALGVNFKKNEKDYDVSNSAVYRMLKEAENDRGGFNDHEVNPQPQKEEEAHQDCEPDSGIVTAPNRGIAGLKHVEAPINKPAPAAPQLPPGQNICAECERLIVGVFVRIKDKNLHVECFKCSTCGSSLKNVGYYNINNKLYCDIHAKSAALSNSAAPGLIPVTLSPGGRAPAGAISAALSNHPLPSGPLSPPHQPSDVTNGTSPHSAPVSNLSTLKISDSNANKSLSNNSSSLYNSAAPLSFSKYINKSQTNLSGPRSFSSVSAPLSPGGNTFPRAAPLSPPTNNYAKAPLSPPQQQPYSPVSSVEPVTWPPPKTEGETAPTACPLFYPPPSQVEAEIRLKQACKQSQHEEENEFYEEENLELKNICGMDETSSFYSDEFSFSGRKTATECAEIVSEHLDTQQMVERVIRLTPQLVPQTLELEDIELLQKHNQQTKISATDEKPIDLIIPESTFDQPENKMDLAVPKKWESTLTQAARTDSPAPDTFAQLPSTVIPNYRPVSPFVSALVTAPAEPFSTTSKDTAEAVPLPEFTEPYIPPPHPVIIEKSDDELAQEKPKKFKEDPPNPMSPFTKALEIAPDRPFSPVGGIPSIPKPIIKKKPKDPLDEVLNELPKPAEKLDMRTALTYAPDRPYTPVIEIGEVEKKDNIQKSKYAHDSENLNKAVKPEELPASFKMNVKEPKPPSYYPPSVIQEFIETGEEVEKQEKTETKYVEKQMLKTIPSIPQQTIVISNPQETQTATNFPPIFQGFSCSFQNKTDYSHFSVEVSTSPPVPTPPPKPATPMAYVATLEQKPSNIIQQTEKVVQESRTHQESSLRQEIKTITQDAQQVCQKYQQEASSSQQSKKESIPKQKEEVVRITPSNTTVMLRKPEKMPQYQENIKAAAESDLLLLKRKEESKARMDQQKRAEKTHIQEQYQTKEHADLVSSKEIKQIALHQQDSSLQPPESKKVPVITIAQGDNSNLPPKVNFNSVENNKLRRVSPHRSITPSMIQNAPPLLPYYQEDLVHHYHPAVKSNVLDPKSPNISRSPTPNIAKIRATSPSFRGKSPIPEPAQKVQQPIQRSATPEQIEKAKESIQSSVSEHQSQSCALNNQQQTCTRPCSQNKIDQKPCHQQQICERPCLQGQNICPISNPQSCGKICPMQWDQQTFAASAEEKYHSFDEKSGSGAIVRTNVAEKSSESQLQAQNIVKSQECEISTDGRTQIQRKKTVTEEYEHLHNEKSIEIQKNTTKYAFNKINEGAIEDSKTPIVQGMHVTNPGHIVSPFKRMVQAIQQDPPQLDQKCERLKSADTYDIKPLPTTKFIEVRRDSGISVLPVPPPTPTGALLFSTPTPVPQASSFDISSAPQCSLNKAVVPPPTNPSTKHVSPPRDKCSQSVPKSDVGASSGRQAGGVSVAPKKGRGTLNPAPMGRIPLCGHCHGQIRGPFITALGKIWCPQHFICATPSCKRSLQDLGFVEEKGQLYCEYCFEQYLAPPCAKCSSKIKGDCLKAIGKNFHPECFNCSYCGKLFGNCPFFLEDGSPYCEADWNELFTTKCFACGFPIEAGDRWVEALSNNYHSLCFNCTMCKKNLEGQSFFAKGGRPYCKTHAR